MPAIHRRTLLLAGLALPGAACARQERGVPAEPSLFRQVVKTPTGNNGYEEFVLAADEVRSSALFKQAEVTLGSPAGCPLSLKRRLLRDPPISRAFDLLRRGVAKPVTSPRPITWNSTTPEVSEFRRLARLLAARQEVALAEGNVPEALASLRLGLRFGFAIQVDTLLTALVALAVQAIVVRPVAERLGQPGARDCEELFRIAIEWLGWPDPLPRIIAAERRMNLDYLAELQAADHAGLEKMLLTDPESGDPHFRDLWRAANEEERRRIADLDRLKAAPDGGASAFAQAAQQLDEHFTQVQSELRKPLFERAKVELEMDDSPAGRILSMVGGTPWLAQEQIAGGTARARLLACHAAVRRYLWERDHLSPNLEALRLRELAIDPYTGEPLIYEVAGARYRLASVGPQLGDDFPGTVNGRRPITLVPGE